MRKNIFLFVFIVFQGFFLILFLFSVSFFYKSLPAPHISVSESFNEKARWLRKINNNNCDILVLGSSVALNNVDWSLISDLKNKSIINTASWGLTIDESAKLLDVLTPICKPHTIVLVSYFGDFVNEEKKTINWSLFDEYLKTDYEELLYLKTANFNYYLSSFMSRKRINQKGNSVYQSLLFDNTGTVLLDCENFQIEKARWDSYINLKKLKFNTIHNSLNDLSLLEDKAKRINSEFIVIASPLRPIAKQKSIEIGIEELWSSVELSVLNSGGKFINLANLNELSDADFTDTAHLNACGARKMAYFISDKM